MTFTTVILLAVFSVTQAQHEMRRLTFKKTARGFILTLPVLTAACLHLDLGTVLALRKLDPYSVDLMNSRAAVLVPEGVLFDEHIEVNLRMRRDETVFDEAKFALKTLSEGEDLPGVELSDFPSRPIIIRLANADYERAIALQKKLSVLDKNHQWIEPDAGTVSTPKQASTTRTAKKDEALAKGDVQGDLGLKWQFHLSPRGREKYCDRGKTIRLTAWVKLNDSPIYKRVIHGLPLKRLYGKESMKALCNGKTQDSP
jgi:hypothetical protein